MSKAPLNTSQLRNVWGPPCRMGTTVVSLHGGARVTVDTRIVDAVDALSAILARHDYQATPPDCGAYVCRQITGGTGYSLHAYGIAIDINWLDNPYTTGRLVTDMPAQMVRDITALRTRSGAPVWGWGGHYRSIKDAMHYEIVCTPADLATGIANAQEDLSIVDTATKGYLDAKFFKVVVLIKQESLKNLKATWKSRQLAGADDDDIKAAVKALEDEIEELQKQDQ